MRYNVHKTLILWCFGEGPSDLVPAQRLLSSSKCNVGFFTHARKFMPTSSEYYAYPCKAMLAKTTIQEALLLQ
eukprot:2481934-Amphidinium_carterae.1